MDGSFVNFTAIHAESRSGRDTSTRSWYCFECSSSNTAADSSLRVRSVGQRTGAAASTLEAPESRPVRQCFELPAADVDRKWATSHILTAISERSQPRLCIIFVPNGIIAGDSYCRILIEHERADRRLSLSPCCSRRSSSDRRRHHDRVFGTHPYTASLESELYNHDQPLIHWASTEQLHPLTASRERRLDDTARTESDYNDVLVTDLMTAISEPRLTLVERCFRRSHKVKHRDRHVSGTAFDQPLSFPTVVLRLGVHTLEKACPWQRQRRPVWTCGYTTTARPWRRGIRIQDNSNTTQTMPYTARDHANKVRRPKDHPLLSSIWETHNKHSLYNQRIRIGRVSSYPRESHPSPTSRQNSAKALNDLRCPPSAPCDSSSP